MKRDQYIPHEVSMRNTSEVMNLIKKEGMTGYGIYWALMEYLRVQDGYVGDMEALDVLKRELKIRQAKLDKVLHGYGLFVCNGNTFYSPKLNEVMKPFEQRRVRIEAYKRQKEKENLLEISEVSSEKSDIVSFEVKGKGEGKTTSTKEEKDDDVVAVIPVPSTLAWERYIDELHQEQQWIEVLGYPGVASFKYNTHNGRFISIEEGKTPDIPDIVPDYDNSNWLAKKVPEQKRLGI